VARERTAMTPSLLGSALLHGGLLVATLVSWPWLSKPMKMESSVPVTIVANAPATNIRRAIQAPEPMEALTETPVPEATPEPVAPPAPEPPAPAPKPVAKAAAKPMPKPAPPTPAPKKAEAKPQPKKAAPTLDLDALAQSLKPAKASGKPKSSAAKGPSRSETAAQARLAAGPATGLAASALSSLGADLARRWNPNCAVEGGSDVDIRVAFRLNDAGHVVGQPESSGESSANPVVKAASDRAKRAIRQAEPFENLPDDLYGERIVVRFNARTACATG
jgi:protein TonB